MNTVDSVVQILGGAFGSGAIAGYWLFRSLKKITELEADIKALNAKVEARDAARLHDHQTVLQDVVAALTGAEPPEEPNKEPRSPTGRHRRP